MKSFIKSLFYFSILILVFSCSDENKHDRNDHSNHSDNSDGSVVYYCTMCPGQEQDSPGICKVCGMDLVIKPNKGDNNMEVFTCPMHPEIIKDAPGICPICKMDLVKKGDDSSNSDNGIIVKPVTSYVLAKVPIIKPFEKSLPVKVKATGYITYDPSRVNDVSSRFEGRIDKLYKKYKYQPVKKGEPLFDVFSHSLIAAQQEYLFLKENETDQHLLQKARKKLELLGLTSSQIDHLNGHHHKGTVTVFSPYSGFLVASNDPSSGITTNASSMSNMDSPSSAENTNQTKDELLKEGSFISKGEPVLKIVNTEVVWALLNVYSKDIKSIKQGQSVTLLIQGMSETLSAKVNYVETVLNEETQTVQIRIVLPNRDGSKKINSLVNAEILAEPVKGIWVPDKAVYDLGNQLIVFKKEGEYFKSYEVETGSSSEGFIQILDGVSEGDEIASVASYLVDSESLIKVVK